MSVKATLDLERAVLGALMANNLALDDVAEILSTADFSSRPHRQVFEVMQSMADRGEPFDAQILAGKVQGAESADLVCMQLDCLAPANAPHYARQLREKSGSRALEQIGYQISQLAQSDQPLADKSDQAQALVQGLDTGTLRGGSGFEPIKKLLTDAVDRIDTLHRQENPLTGVSTGFTEIDDMTAGLQASDLIIIAGTTSMGKTALAMNFAEHAVTKEGKTVAVFSMEMSGQQLAFRLMSSLGRIDQTKVRTGWLKDDDWPKLTSAVSILSESPLFIDATPALSPTELRARARRLSREHEIGLVVVDYLQLMQVPGHKGNRTGEISEISRSLKALAKELNVPVVALSQLNRGLANRPNKRPLMSDLRESGAIEQDADVIMFIYRDEVYDKDSPDKGLAEIIIAKQRNGPIGTLRLTFMGKHCRFENYLAVESYNPEDYA